ncbi:MAG: YceI family protein [Algibacter sp.]
MKNRIKSLAIVALVALFTFSFTVIDGGKKEVNTDKSSVVWKGYKVTGSHVGAISIESGNLIFDRNTLTGGEFVIDMTSITVTDLDGEYKGKLEGHLKSDDFFGVANHPKANLVFKNVKSSGKNSYTVIGDLTIKGKTNSITFNVSIYGSKANVALKIDRTKYGVEYNSTSFFENLKDKAIYDEFDLTADLEF